MSLNMVFQKFIFLQFSPEHFSAQDNQKNNKWDS